MAVSAYMYGLALGHAFSKDISWASDTIKVALLSASYTPSQDTHEFWATHAQSYEVSGTGYTAGGATLASKTSTYDATTNATRLDAADVQWTGSTVTARYAVIYDDTSVNKPLLGYVDFGSAQSTSGTTFEIVWHANGIFEIAAA